MTRPDFRAAIVPFWLRLSTLAALGLLFATALSLSKGEAQGWTFYLTTPEIVFEILVRLVFAGLAGIGAATLCAAALAPFLWKFAASRERIIRWAMRVGVIAVVFLDAMYAVRVLLASWGIALDRDIATVLLIGEVVVCAAVLLVPQARRKIAVSADGWLQERTARRIMIAILAGGVGLSAAEFAFSKTLPTGKSAPSAARPKSNILLVTFDALSAEDMSIYGQTRETTPNIDAFARTGTVFRNYYSISTFTGSSVATMLTGVYPSQHHVYHLMGRIRPEYAGQSLPYQMQAAGYATGAFISNWAAYYIAENLRTAYNILPEPTFQKGVVRWLWAATGPLHQHTGLGNRTDEYQDLTALWNPLAGLPVNLNLQFPAAESFAEARKIVDQLPEGYFLWVHVMTPHGPYHPGAAERGRFISDDELRTFEFEETDSMVHPVPSRYEPKDQGRVDQRRLAYDEFLLTADRAFGAFMTDLETRGRLRNTTVIVSADHGESFEGGIYQHGGRFLTRPVLHIPLIIRTPHQQEGRSVAFVADQTALAPTILELAGQKKPAWMTGQSLAKWLTGDRTGEGEGLAFNQYLEINSIFKPPQHGSASVIDGQYQYVVVLASQNGGLRPMGEAQIWNVDRTSEYPEKAKALREALALRFPDIVRRTR
ncbi:MAG TPA: sulfatase [Candidatus Sulfopaludibacter sp.]|nr:sulfatase [Candidatus Sulfopaludibacter sp.]